VIEIRRDQDIYDVEGEWFRARWHFSFDQYHDPDHISFGAMRVFNDDRLIPGAIWPMHPHRDIEGLTYVVDGTFGHEDNVGGPFGPLPAGSVQRMTLGSGAEHSERNGSVDEPMRFLQFWILPDTPSLPPSLEQRQLGREDRLHRLRKVIGPEGGEVVKVHQDASASVAALEPGDEVEHAFGQERAGYLYVIEGSVSLNGSERLETGDAVKAFGPETLSIRAERDAELILIEVPSAFEPVGVWAR